jgi:hypothetical protein
VAGSKAPAGSRRTGCWACRWFADDAIDVVVRKALLLARQPEPIPVFLKRGSNKWVYDTRYRFRNQIEDRRWLEEREHSERKNVNRGSGRRGEGSDDVRI